MDSKVPALQRGMEIINLVGKYNECNLAQIEMELNIPKASLSRLMQYLLKSGVLSYNSNKNLELGDSLTQNVIQAYDRNPLILKIKPLLKMLSQKWHETFVVYEYREPFNLIWRAKEEPMGGIITRSPGFMIKHLNVNAQGQLFLSYLNNNSVFDYIEQGLVKRINKYTLIEPDDLLKRLDVIRDKGYAYIERENNLSMKQIAVPLNMREFNGIYALGCFLPIDFSETDKLIDSMLLESSRFSEVE